MSQSNKNKSKSKNSSHPTKPQSTNNKKSTFHWKPSAADEKYWQDNKGYFYEVQWEYEEYGEEYSWCPSTEPCPFCGQTKQTGCECSAESLNFIMSTSWVDDLIECRKIQETLFENEDKDLPKEIAEMEFKDWMLNAYLQEKEDVYLKEKSKDPQCNAGLHKEKKTK